MTKPTPELRALAYAMESMSHTERMEAIERYADKATSKVNKPTSPVDIDKLNKSLDYLYSLNTDTAIPPELVVGIGILRQLINEEFVGHNKTISSQIIYDILAPELILAIRNAVNEARIDEVKLLGTLDVRSIAVYNHYQDRLSALDKYTKNSDNIS